MRLLDEAGFDDIRIYEYNPTSWLPLSIMQWRNQKQTKAKYNHPRLLALACYPIGWLAAQCGMGEELVGIGKLYSESAS